MAIYLDTNALYRWRNFAQLKRLALSVVADQLGQCVVLPGLVVEEAAHNHRTYLDEAIRAHAEAVQNLSDRFGVTFSDELEPLPDVDDAERTWRRRLSEWTTTVETTGENALGGLHREIHRICPAKEGPKAYGGVGGRDAAIWLTIAAHHRESGQPGHFITDDRAFAKNDRLHPRLVADITDSQPMELYPDVHSFVAQCGRYASADISVGDLTRRGAHRHEGPRIFGRSRICGVGHRPHASSAAQRNHCRRSCRRETRQGLHCRRRHCHAGRR